MVLTIKCCPEKKSSGDPDLVYYEPCYLKVCWHSKHLICYDTWTINVTSENRVKTVLTAVSCNVGWNNNSKTSVVI